MSKRDSLYKGRDESFSRSGATRSFRRSVEFLRGLSITVNICGITHLRIAKINYRAGRGERGREGEKARRGRRHRGWNSWESYAGRRLSCIDCRDAGARLGVGTPAVKAAPSKRRDSPEFTWRAHVRTCGWTVPSTRRRIVHPARFHASSFHASRRVYLIRATWDLRMTVLVQRYALSLG